MRRLALLLFVLALAGCTTDFFGDASRDARFDIDAVTGVYVGERTLVVDGETLATEPVTATVTRDGGAGYGTAEIAIDTDGSVSTFVGSYDTSGLYIGGYDTGFVQQIVVDGDGFVTGSLSIGGETREYTGRLTAEAFDLYERSPDGRFRDDVRTVRR